MDLVVKQRATTYNWCPVTTKIPYLLRNVNENVAESSEERPRKLSTPSAEHLASVHKWCMTCSFTCSEECHNMKHKTYSVPSDFLQSNAGCRLTELAIYCSIDWELAAKYRHEVVAKLDMLLADSGVLDQVTAHIAAKNKYELQRTKHFLKKAADIIGKNQQSNTTLFDILNELEKYGSFCRGMQLYVEEAAADLELINYLVEDLSNNDYPKSLTRVMTACSNKLVPSQLQTHPFHRKKCFFEISVNGVPLGKIFVILDALFAPELVLKFIKHYCIDEKSSCTTGGVIRKATPDCLMIQGPGEDQVFQTPLSPLARNRGTLFFVQKFDCVRKQRRIVRTEFGIQLADNNPEPDSKSSVFGYVVEGLELCDDIGCTVSSQDVKISRAGMCN